MLKPQLGLLQGSFGPPQIGAVLFGFVQFLKPHVFAGRNDRWAQHDKVTGRLFLGNSVNLERQLDSFDFTLRIQSCKPTCNRGAVAFLRGIKQPEVHEG